MHKSTARASMKTQKHNSTTSTTKKSTNTLKRKQKTTLVAKSKRSLTTTTKSKTPATPLINPSQQPLHIQSVPFTTTAKLTNTNTRSIKKNTLSKSKNGQNFFTTTTSTTSTPFTPLTTTTRRTYMNPDFHGIDYTPTGKPIHRATTILCVRKGEEVVMIGDGQVSLGPTVVKPNARKIRRIGTNNDVIVGFAGSTADAFTLLGLLENQLELHPGQLLRASVETAKLWRTDKMSRHLEAMLIASDENISLCISGNGDVIESHDGLLGIGSGSTYALAAARALIDLDTMDSMTIAKKAMNIAADICVYTNHNFVIDSIRIPIVHTLNPGDATSLSIPIGGTEGPEYTSSQKL